jgi:alcohol dehydrogenase (cytochrome c)
MLAVPLTVVALAAQAPPALVSSQELLDGLKPDGSKWLTFGGNYSNHRFSPLTQITPDNVNRLVPQWTFQTNTLGNFETTPLVRDNAWPMVRKWRGHRRAHRPPDRRYAASCPRPLTACCGLANRGFSGRLLFMTTLDAQSLALDMKTGDVVFDVTLEDYKKGYAATIARIGEGKVIAATPAASTASAASSTPTTSRPASGSGFTRFPAGRAGPQQLGGDSWTRRVGASG